MSNSRKPGNRRPPRDRRAVLAEHLPHLRLMMAADAAERNGDASRALELIRSSPNGPDGRPYWTPWRVRRLEQLVAWGEWLPGWATSRWLLAQAQQWMYDDTDVRHRALHTAIELRGGEQELPGVDEIDAKCRVIDHDWAYRQLYLYDLGGLTRFLPSVAPHLVAAADRIHDWAAAPMGGFELIDQRPRAVVWRDLGSGRPVRTPNTGSAALVLPGEFVVGRLVPIERGSMFEAAPIDVPRSVAVRVAGHPEAWVDALREARPGPDEPAINTARQHPDLLTDVPRTVWEWVAFDGERPTDPTRLAHAVLDCARLELAEPTLYPGDVNPWPCLAAAIVEPEVAQALSTHTGSTDTDVLIRLAAVLPEPAATVCRQLVAGRSEAA